jgi:spore germination protein (amino acid permease)
MIGIGALSLPGDAIKYAKQDGWISTFLGLVYPLYITIMASLIQKKFPKENILIVNKKCFGKIIGTFFNIFLFLFFLLYLTAEIAGLSTVIRVVIISFLPSLKVYIVLAFLGAYTAYKGLKVLGRISETMFYLTLTICLLAVGGIFNGKISNIRPIFDTGIMNIIKSSVESAYEYAGMEMYLLIYPYVSGKTNLRKAAIKSTFITAIIYTWIVFITIYNLGIGVISKITISFPLSVKYIEIPVINNFRFIFMSLWSLMVFALISNYYYATSTILSSIFSKVDQKKFCFILYPFVVFLATAYFNDTLRRNFLDFIIPKVTVAMFIYIFITVLLVYFRKVDKCE